MAPFAYLSEFIGDIDSGKGINEAVDELAGLIMDDRLMYDEKASIGGKHLRANSLSLKKKGMGNNRKSCCSH